MNHINSDYTRFTHTLVEDLSSRLHSAYCREDAMADYGKLARIHAAFGQNAAYSHGKWDLVKKLNAAGIACTRDTSLVALKERIDCMPTMDELEAELYEELFRVYSQFPTASDFMARLVKRLADPDLICDSTRLTIVRQFLRHTNYCTLAVKKIVAGLEGVDAKSLEREDVIRLADERIFDILEKSMSRDDRRKYALIRLADDLAGGKFRMGGKTKSDLYLFAFAFRMTVFTGAPGEELDPERDLEKNLFRDFYNDNLLRYASKDYQDNITAYEQEPSGEGINYKNFAEVIYLYYLCQPKLTPRRRLSDANARIDECVQRIREQRKVQQTQGILPEPEADDVPEHTRYYHDQFLQKVCALSPDELVRFVCENYQFPEDLDQVANISVESARRTAAGIYDDLLAQVLELTTEEELEELSYDLDTHIAMSRHDEDSPFAIIMEKLNQMLSIRWCGYPVSGTEAEEKLTRTNLIALYACFYRLNGWAKGLTIPRLLKNFRTMIDPMLVDSRFQPISEKNIFDMFTIIALYHLENHNAPLD